MALNQDDQDDLLVLNALEAWLSTLPNQTATDLGGFYAMYTAPLYREVLQGNLSLFAEDFPNQLVFQRTNHSGFKLSLPQPPRVRTTTSQNPQPPTNYNGLQTVPLTPPRLISNNYSPPVLPSHFNNTSNTTTHVKQRVNFVNGAFQSLPLNNSNNQSSIPDSWQGYNASSDQQLVVTKRDDYKALIELLPERYRTQAWHLPSWDKVLEFLVDIGRPLTVRFITHEPDTKVGGVDEIISLQDLENIATVIGWFSSDNRGGIDNRLHRISQRLNLRGEVVGMTLRFATESTRATWLIRDIVQRICRVPSNMAEMAPSILFLGAPGKGKSTVMRELAKALSQTLRVEIVDTSNELAGVGNAPHSAVGNARRLMVPVRQDQHKVLIEAVQNHTPDVIVVDELGNRLEAQAACEISQRGVCLIASAHAVTLMGLIHNPVLRCLLGGAQSVILSSREAETRGLVNRKTVTEREFEPAFGIVIEIHSFQKWVVYQNAISCVDSLLCGDANGGQETEGNMAEIREMDELGRMSIRFCKAQDVAKFLREEVVEMD